MYNPWKALVELGWWVLTGRERPPQMALDLHPWYSAVAAVFCSWLSAFVALSVAIYLGTSQRYASLWLLGGIGAIALLWAPTLYAARASGRVLRRLSFIAVSIGLPVWVLPMPAEVGFSGVHRFTFWMLIGLTTAMAVPLLAIPLRLMRVRKHDQGVATH